MMCRKCASNLSCGSGKMVSGATVGGVWCCTSANSPTVTPLSISPLSQLDFKFKMNSAEWYVGWTKILLCTTCYVIATVHLGLRNTV